MSYDHTLVTERRLLREAQEDQIAVIDMGGPDCARVEVSYGDEGAGILQNDELTHCGYFIVTCHKPEEWNDEDEPYGPYASSEALIRDWFEARPDFCDWWEIDDTYAY